MKIALIGCTKKKKKFKSKAIDLYDESPYYRWRLKYVNEIILADKIYILSAKHELLDSNKEIEPYQVCLKDKGFDIEAWSQNVLKQILSEGIKTTDEIFILSGIEYYKYLGPLLEKAGYKVNIVLDGKGKIGEQVHWLKEQLKNNNCPEFYCSELF